MKVNTTLAAWCLIAVGGRLLGHSTLSSLLRSRRLPVIREVSHGQ